LDGRPLSPHTYSRRFNCITSDDWAATDKMGRCTQCAFVFVAVETVVQASQTHETLARKSGYRREKACEPRSAITNNLRLLHLHYGNAHSTLLRNHSLELAGECSLCNDVQNVRSQRDSCLLTNRDFTQAEFTVRLAACFVCERCAAVANVVKQPIHTISAYFSSDNSFSTLFSSQVFSKLHSIHDHGSREKYHKIFIKSVLELIILKKSCNM